MEKHIIEFKNFILLDGEYLKTRKGLTKSKFIGRTGLWSEYVFYNDHIGISYGIDWKDLIPEIDILRIINKKIPEEYRLNSDGVLVRVSLIEILKEMKYQLSHPYYSKNRFQNIEELNAHFQYLNTLLKDNFDFIYNNFDTILDQMSYQGKK